MNDSHIISAEVHCGIALYGDFTVGSRFSDIYDSSLELFEALGIRPDVAGGNPDGKTIDGYRRFKLLDGMFRKSVFAGMTHFEMVTRSEQFKKVRHGEFYSETLAACYSQAEWGNYYIVYGKINVFDNRLDTLLAHVKSVIRLLKPDYGFYFERPFNHGPMFYGMGMRFNNNCTFDDDNMEKWHSLMMGHAYTLLRSVYPLNFLTSIQLSIRFNTTSLEEWIRADVSRGTLSPFTDTITLWTVPEDRIRPVRDKLWETGVILDRKRHFDEPFLQYSMSESQIAEHYRTGQPINPNPSRHGLSEQELLDRIAGPNQEILKVVSPGVVENVTPSKRPKRGKK